MYRHFYDGLCAKINDAKTIMTKERLKVAKNNGSGATVAVAKQPFNLKKALKNNLGFWFILPWLIGFLVFKWC